MNQIVNYVIAAILIVQIPIYGESGYDEEFVDLIELVYGEGYLSQGGSEMVEKMFEGANLENKKILDLGCGIGGPALHLIKNNHVTVVGIDPEPLMIQKSQTALEQLLAKSDTPLKGSAFFEIMKDPLNLQQFPDNSFDIVTSKEAILHVPVAHKLNYFQEVFRVLKNDGQLIIVDWQHSSPNYSDDVRAMMEMDDVPFHLTTAKEYCRILQKTGFCNIVLNDLSPLLAEQTEQDLAIIEAKRQQIIEKFGQETYDCSRRSWTIQKQAFQNRELLVGLIRASKN